MAITPPGSTQGVYGGKSKSEAASEILLSMQRRWMNPELYAKPTASGQYMPTVEEGIELLINLDIGTAEVLEYLKSFYQMVEEPDYVDAAETAFYGYMQQVDKDPEDADTPKVTPYPELVGLGDPDAPRTDLEPLDLSDPREQRTRLELMDVDPAGRSDLYRQFLASSLPSITPDPFRTYMEGQYAPISAGYMLQSALGQNTNPFLDFLPSARVPSGDDLLTMLAELMPKFKGQNEPEDVYRARQRTWEDVRHADYLPEPQRMAIENIGADQMEQFRLAHAVGAPQVLGPFRQTFTDKLARAFQQFQTVRPDVNFLTEYFNRGNLRIPR